MTAAIALDEGQPTRAEQLEQLRRQMAAVSGKVGAGWRGVTPADAGLPGSESVLPVPQSLAGLLPAPRLVNAINLVIESSWITTQNLLHAIRHQVVGWC